MKVKFVWDISKAESNRRKHGVTFDEATEIFFDPQSVTYPDEMHSIDEDRFLTLGKSKKLRLLLVVHTEVDSIDNDVIIRIISARKASKEERLNYEES
jgi:uncharacterized protein